jgi:hypothetical protein
MKALATKVSMGFDFELQQSKQVEMLFCVLCFGDLAYCVSVPAIFATVLVVSRPRRVSVTTMIVGKSTTRNLFTTSDKTGILGGQIAHDY